jgi:3-hydroxy-9,10-secoandrosta-1,3,5(10)-triene-9,17-dione monooxygenase
VFVPEHRTVALRDLYDGTTPGARVHPDYDLLRAPRGFLVPFSLAPVGFPLGRRALALTAEAMRTRLQRGMRRMADSEVVQLHLGKAGAAIEVANLVLHARRDESMAILRSRTVYDTDRLQMLARDLQAIMTHYTVSRQAAMVPYGRLLLGLAPEAGEA